MALTRETFSAIQATTKEVPLPDSAETVWIRTISASQREAFDNMVMASGADNVPDLPARLVCCCLCDPDGTLFYPEVIGDITKLAEAATELGKHVATPIMGVVFYACRDLNRMNQDAIEEAAKNFETTPDASSSTD